MTRSTNFNRHGRGFTLLEVCFAICILVTGLAAIAALFGKVWGGTSYSEYMIQASTLVSEKLEDLNRYPHNDPDVAVTSGGIAGSLTSDLEQTVTSSGVTEIVDYYDEIYMSPMSGSISETVVSGTSPGLTYATTTHSPNGTMLTTTSTSLSSIAANSIAFERRWVIESNPVVNGIVITGGLRITVLVTLENQSVQPPVHFQMSIVRP
jgi:Tfp pilus assembly protein PilV